MATVDTAVRFNKFNSLRLEHGETSWSQKFEVGLYSAVTVQAQVLCLDGAASGQFIMRWLDEDNKKLIDSTDGFSITNKWARKTATFEVPEEAAQCMFALKNTDGTKEINVACAMAEAGEIASAFDPSLASQVSLLNAQGLYTGIVSANQVFAGILQSLDGKAYFDLEKPEIVMQGRDATWKASPENPLRLEDGEDELIGGLVRLPDGKMAVITSALGNAEDLSGGYAFIGKHPERDLSGIHFQKDGNSYSLRLGAFSGADEGLALEVDEVRRAVWYKTGSFALFSDSNYYPRLLIGDDASGRSKIEINDADNQPRLAISDFTPIQINAANLQIVLYINDDTAMIRPATGNHELGVDSTGPYYVRSGTKKYLT